MKRIAIIAMGLAALFMTYVGVELSKVPRFSETLPPLQRTGHLISGIVSGDTVETLIRGKFENVRLIGFEAPDEGECFAGEAVERLKLMLEASPVLLEADASQGNRDLHGRLLRHVFLPNGRNAAEILISEGYGKDRPLASPHRYRFEFLKAQFDARDGALGIWSPECAVRIEEKNARP
jgi:endonuclease YncB( thermonuclease family)